MICKTYLKDLNSDIFYMHQCKVSNFVTENSSILTEYISQPIIFTIHTTCLLSCPCMLVSHPWRTTTGTNPALVSPFLLDECILSLTNRESAKGAPLQVPGQKEWEMVQAWTLSAYNRGWGLQLPEGSDCFSVTICLSFITVYI